MKSIFVYVNTCTEKAVMLTARGKCKTQARHFWMPRVYLADDMKHLTCEEFPIEGFYQTIPDFIQKQRERDGNKQYTKTH